MVGFDAEHLIHLVQHVPVLSGGDHLDVGATPVPEPENERGRFDRFWPGAIDDEDQWACLLYTSRCV